MFSSFWQNPAIRIPFAISIGAIVGSLLRYYLGLWFKSIAIVDYFSFGTLFVNITGCFLMGLFITFTTEQLFNFSPDVVAMITVGFLGSYTTFSSYELETINLLLAEKKQLSLLYWLGSPILGFIAIKCGIWLGKFIVNKF